MTKVSFRLRQSADGKLSAAKDVVVDFTATQPGPTDPPPPPPPPPGDEALIGMNFETNAVGGYNTPYEPRAQIARIYIDNGRTSIRQEPEFNRAYDTYGIRAFVFSNKETTTTHQAQVMATIPDDCSWDWINHHEPEDDIPSGFSLAQWQAWQDAMSPIVVDHGGTPALCLMAYTINPASGRHVSDYARAAGVHQRLWFDYYPNKAPNKTQAWMVQGMRDAAETLGIDSLGIGEYGILQGSIYNASTVAAFHELTSDFYGKCYWSQDHGQNQKFTPAVADAWFAPIE